jgi:hypothetical protein
VLGHRTGDAAPALSAACLACRGGCVVSLRSLVGTCVSCGRSLLLLLELCLHVSHLLLQCAPLLLQLLQLCRL